MHGRFITILSSGALALSVNSASVLAAPYDKEQSKMPASLAGPAALASKGIAKIAATAATSALPVLPAQEKKKNQK